MFKTLLGWGVGIAAAFFFDPEHGRRRRAMARDRGGRILRRAFRGLLSRSRYLGGKAYGFTREAIRSRPTDLSKVRNAIPPKLREIRRAA